VFRYRALLSESVCADCAGVRSWSLDRAHHRLGLPRRRRCRRGCVDAGRREAAPHRQGEAAGSRNRAVDAGDVWLTNRLPCGEIVPARRENESMPSTFVVVTDAEASARDLLEISFDIDTHASSMRQSDE
jgi:hypothetical protein